MEITKVDLNSGKLYEIFMQDEPEGHPTRLAYYIEEMGSEKEIAFGGNNEAVYHVVMNGTMTYKKDQSEEILANPGDIIYCELENEMRINGQGKLLSVFMEKSVHGITRVLSVENETKVKLGEVVGESCVALAGLNGGFVMNCDHTSYKCDEGEILFVRMEKKELANAQLVTEQPTRIAFFTNVKMFDSDFSKHMGLYTVEQGYGYCKVRLDIKKEHMNPIGSVHGGALFTMADEACGIAASTTGGVCTTVDSHIEFLNAAIGVKYLTAEAKPKKIGKKIRSFIVEIKDEKERLIATADFIFFCLQN